MPSERRIFLIGPAGVGKSTCGPIVAKTLEYEFVDQDSEFNRRIGDIGVYIREKGYLDYCRQNSELFYSLMSETSSATVYALSSGFLINEELDERFKRHADDLRNLGISILLLPSESLEETVDIVVNRVVSRRSGVDAKKEVRKIRERYTKYLNFGAIKVYCSGSPAIVAGKIISEYLPFLAKMQPTR